MVFSALRHPVELMSDTVGVPIASIDVRACILQTMLASRRLSPLTTSTEVFVSATNREHLWGRDRNRQLAGGSTDAGLFPRPPS